MAEARFSRRGGISGCNIRELKGPACESFLAWVLGGPRPVSAPGDLRFALFHLLQGVTWARLDGDRWALASDAAPEVCPRPSVGSLMEFRLFGPSAEVHVWRNDAVMGGCIVSDAETPDKHLMPRHSSLLLLGDRVVRRMGNGFTEVEDKGGRAQVLPLDMDDSVLGEARLRTVEYLERDPDTGVVRVALRRLAGIVAKEG